MSAAPNVPQPVLDAEKPFTAHHEFLQNKPSVAHVENVPSNDVHEIHDAKKTNGVNGVHHAESKTGQFQLHDTVVENFRPIKVIVIGAGYSGIYHGIRIPERIKNCDLVIYEKNAGVGGTWYENRYPGCACDIPSHSYQYSFNPNPNWSALYAPAREIQAYLESTADKFSVKRFIKLEHEVKECRYDEAEGKWHVKVKRPNGEVFEDTSDILINARGGLNHIAWPEIEGLRSFEGEIMHSAAWNDEYDFKNKRVGVIGSGSSAIQIIPNLQKVAGTHLSCFIRSKTWISPPFGQELQDEMGMKSIEFPEEMRKRFAEDPAYLQQFRMKIETGGNEIHALTIMGTEMQKGARANFEATMKERLAKRPEYYEWLKPDFAPVCRRLTPGPGFLEALCEDNVSFIRDRITSIEAKGVRTADGKLHGIDVLVCATGFHTAAPPPFPIIGLNGTDLGTHWASRAETYLSLATHDFPNMYIMLGPNAAIGSGSLTMMIENVGDYIVKCIRKTQKENIKSMAIKPRRVRDFTKVIDAYFKGTVFMDDCKSWYRKGDQVTGLWPGSTLHCIEALRSPRWEDYEYEYADEGNGDEANQMAWLGNGWSVNQVEERDYAWYLMPEFQSPPTAPLPEGHPLYTIRAWSH